MKKVDWYAYLEDRVRKSRDSFRQISVWANNGAQDMDRIAAEATEQAGLAQLALDGLTSKRKLADLPPVRIEVRGGCVVGVSGLPPGYDYEIVDYDGRDEAGPA